MKGLEAIPSSNDLVIAFNDLQSKPLTCATLLKYFPWVRFDPRLGEILVGKIIQDWQQLNPFEIFLELKHRSWSPVMGVLLDMAEIGISEHQQTAFRTWKTCALSQLAHAPHEMFFIGLYAFAGKLMERQSRQANQIYKRWGFLGTDLMYNKAKTLTTKKTLLNVADRLKVLTEILTRKTEISVSDYLAELPAPVSRRVAELDLQKFPGLRAYGQTNARIYRRIR